MILAVFAPFAEAVRGTAQPCSFLLVVPILTAVVAARATWQALGAGTVAAVLGGWVLVDNRWVLEGASLRVSALLVIALLIGLVAPLGDGRLRSVWSDRVWARSTMVGVVAFVATMWWRPCVGREFGEILNADSFAAQAVPMAFYMLGALVPVAAVVAVRYAAALSERSIAPLTWVGASLGIVVAVSLVAGRHDDIVVTLTRWTLE